MAPERESMIHHSIIIPTAGRPIAIKAAIVSILSQELKENNTELIVVDNNTDEMLAQDLEKYCATWQNKLRYVREKSPGLSAARHKGATEAEGNLLTFVDDDVEVSDTWLVAIQTAFKSEKVAMVGGPSIPKFTGSIPVWFWGFFFETPFGGWANSWLSLLDIGQDVEGIDPNYIWGLNFSIRKQVLYDLGGFHPDLVPSSIQRWQGDGETGLTVKLKETDLRADYRQAAMLLHLCGPDRLNIEYFKKRAFYQGVCDSFTQLRDRNQTMAMNTNQTPTSIYRKLRRVAGKIKHKLLPTATNQWSAATTPVFNVTNEAYQQGWQFHQNEAKNDPELMKWIQRENYFDTDIRDFVKR